MNHTLNKKTGQKGSATLLAIFVSAIIITIGIGFNWLVKEHLRAAEALKVKSEAMLEARSAFDALIYLLLSSVRNQKEAAFLSGNELIGAVNMPLNGDEVKVREGLKVSVRDSNGLVSLSSLNEAALKRLIEMLSGQDATGIIDSYLDWIDRDNLARVNGAEESYYKSKGLPYAPRNMPIQYKEELAFIKGMDRELLKKIDPYITTLPSPAFNPNTASETVLRAYLNIDERTVRTLMDYMSKKPVTSDGQLFNLTGRRIDTGEGGAFYPSYFMEVTIKAGSPVPLYTIRAGIDLRQTVRGPYSVLYWVEE